MRNRTSSPHLLADRPSAGTLRFSLASLLTAALVSTASSVALAQIPPIPGLPGQDPNQPPPQQYPPAQPYPAPAPGQPPPAQPAPTLPGGIPIPQLPPGFPNLPPPLPQLPQQGQPPPAQPAPQQFPPAQPYPAPGYGQPPPGQPGQAPYAPYAPQPYGQPGQPGQPGYGAPPYGQPGYDPQAYGPRVRTRLEIGYLYAVSVAYGVGAGVWIDAEAYNGKQVDPGLSALAPILLGAAMPAAVYLGDMHPMREGLPSAIASGLVIGGAEGMAAWAVGSSHNTDPSSPWGFTDFGRAEIIGTTLGGVGGLAYGILLRPTPKKTMLITSGAAWGGIIGYELGGGGTSGPWSSPNFGQTGASAGTSVGGLVGLNLGLIGTAAAAGFWTPSWNQLGWMWAGFGIGEVASTLVYPIYGATNADPRHGLVFQGVAGGIGAVAGAFIGRRDTAASIAREEREDQDWMGHQHFARIRGGGLMSVNKGAGATMSGELW